VTTALMRLLNTLTHSLTHSLNTGSPDCSAKNQLGERHLDDVWRWQMIGWHATMVQRQKYDGWVTLIRRLGDRETCL